jgi:hypothetical protein
MLRQKAKAAWLLLVLLLFAGAAGAQTRVRLSDQATGALVSDNQRAADADFVVHWYPDPQNYSNQASGATLQMWCDQVGYTIANPPVFAMMTGDLVNTAGSAQYTAMDTPPSGAGVDQCTGSTNKGIAALDTAGIPYAPAPGNHDYTAINTRDQTGAGKWDAFFPDTRWSGKSWWLGSYPTGHTENVAYGFTVNGHNYGVLMLGYCFGSTIETWANGILSADPSRLFIVGTHSWLNRGATQSDAGDQYACSLDFSGNEGTNWEHPALTWGAWLSQHDDQIILVANGHDYTSGWPAGRLVIAGAHGYVVPQIHADYQGSTNGGSGYMRILTFHPAAGTISVTTYSPNLAAYQTDQNNQFTLPFRQKLVTAAVGAAFGGHFNGPITSSYPDLRLYDAPTTRQSGIWIHGSNVAATGTPSSAVSQHWLEIALNTNGNAFFGAPKDGGKIYFNYANGAGGEWFCNGAATCEAGVNSTGQLFHSEPVTAKTANYTVLTSDRATVFTNLGASGEIDFTLPAAAAGLTYTFVVEAAQTLKVIAPASTTIQIADSVTSAAGSISSSIIGTAVTLVCTNTTNKTWVATAWDGTWAGVAPTSIYRSITYIAGGDNASAVLADADDQKAIWINDLGRTYRVTRVWAQADGGTPIINLQRDDGSTANLLSANLTLATVNGVCADSATAAMTVHGASITCVNTIVSGERDFAVGDGIDFVLVTAGGTAKRITVNLQLVAQ